MKNKIGFVYLLRNISNGKGYVGQCAGISTNKRWTWHIWAALEGGVNKPLYHAIRKYGVEGFSAEIIWQGDPAQLNDRETHYIATLKTFIGDGRGYNLTRGGGCNRGWVPSETTRQRMSAVQKAAYAVDPTPWQKTAAAQRGIKRTAEQRAATSAATKLAHMRDPQLRWRIAAKNRGYRHTDAAKAKISAASKGHGCTPETRAKISEAKRGKRRGALTASWRARIAAGLQSYHALRREQKLHDAICMACVGRAA